MVLPDGFINLDERVHHLRIDKVLGYLLRDNPKEHDIGGIAKSIRKYGFLDFPLFVRDLTNATGTKGAFIYGNGRAEALYHLWRMGVKAPEMIFDDGYFWFMPCMIVDNVKDAQKFMIDHNALTVTGGNTTNQDIWNLFDTTILKSVVDKMDGGTVTLDNEDLQDYLNYVNGTPPENPVSGIYSIKDYATEAIFILTIDNESSGKVLLNRLKKHGYVVQLLDGN